jgi:hypothetical protein
MSPQQLPYGAYRFPDGTLISIRKSVGKSLRARRYADGYSRRLFPDKKHEYITGPGFSRKSPTEAQIAFERAADGHITGMRWEATGSEAQVAQRVNRVIELEFESDDVRFYAQLHLPNIPGPHPAVVLLHGSGKDAATQFYYNADFYAAHGIATLVYDKRGTGLSNGKFTFDFQQLARDALAAVKLLRDHPEIDAERIALSGYSQGGWVAPLAASMDAGIRFVTVNYGMIESPEVEARLETREEVLRRGVSPNALDVLDDLTAVSVKLVHTDFQEGWDTLQTLRETHKKAPWRKRISGMTIDMFMRLPLFAIKLAGPFFALRGLDWYYSSDAVLDQLNIPMLWLLAENDSGAPNEQTIPKLEAYIASGKPFTLHVFPNADHGILQFEEVEGGRAITGYAPGYFQTEIGWAKAQFGLETS